MSTRPEPSWRSLPRAAGASSSPLALGVQLRQRESESEAHWGPRRVSPATLRSVETGSDDLRLAVRPLVPGSSGGWVQGDASWEAMRRGSLRADPAVLRWFSTLYGIAHDVRVFAGFGDSDWLTLDAVDSALFWPHLRSADDLGIPLVPTRPDQHVELGHDARVTVHIDAVAGGLRVAAHARVADESPIATRAIGGVGVYTVARAGGALRVRLGAVPVGPLSRALLTAAVTVPRTETAEFFDELYPRLVRESPVQAGAGVRLPPERRSTLLLQVRQLPNDVVEHTFAWHVAGHPARALDDTDPDAAEADVRRAVERAWAAASELPMSASGRMSGADAAEFVTLVVPAVAAVPDVRVEHAGLRRVYRELSGDPRVRITTTESTAADWFDLGVIVEIDGRRIPFAPLFRALSQHRRRMLLSDGAHFSLAHPSLDRLRDLIEESKDLVEWEAGPRISRYHVDVWEDFEDLADQSDAAAAWRRAVTAASQREPATEPAPIDERVVTTLRPYQHEGVAWLSALWRAGLGGVLADDMGLGKTVQLLALLAHARRDDPRPALVVAPTSVTSAWQSEAARHTPGLRVHVAEATGIRLDRIDADVVVTSYTLLRLDERAYTAAPWSVVVLDEAQAVKNPRTRVHRAAAALRAGSVFAVTGTPLENSLTDLWAILALTSPGLFPSARRFREEYVRPIERGQVPENAEGAPFRERRLARLRRRIRPFLLRRTKDLVAADLPPRQEQDVRVELSSGHRAVYERVLQRERRKVLGLLDDLDSNRFIVFRSLTLLRMLALAPALVDAGGPGIGSSKLDALRERLVELAAEGHRALVFSQFTSYLDIVERDLSAHGIGFERLDGSTVRRERVIDRFRSGDATVFLISLKAGGVGLTLTEADYVFLLDPWWNPAAEQQAIDRTHRIGQTRPVTVYRLIAAGTIEEKVLALQQRKARLFEAVLDSDGAFSSALTAADVRALLAVDDGSGPP